MFKYSIPIIFQSLNPGRAIAEIKKLLGGVASKPQPEMNPVALQK